MREIHGVARFKIHPGKLDEFKRLSAECLTSVKTKDHGTLRYAAYFNEDETEAVVLESYRDSDALIEHLQNLGKSMEAIKECATITGEVLGLPSAELRKLIGKGPPRIFTPFLEFEGPAPSASSSDGRPDRISGGAPRL